jgi:hypothetical protein
MNGGRYTRPLVKVNGYLGRG